MKKKYWLPLLLAPLCLWGMTACDEFDLPSVSRLDSFFKGKMPPNYIKRESSVLLARPQARRFNVELPLILGVITQESGFNTTAVSRAGALGLMQLMPGTVGHINRNSHVKVSSPFNPAQNIAGGTWYLKSLYNQFQGYPESQRWAFALASYNGGFSRVSAAIQRAAQEQHKPIRLVGWSEIDDYLPRETRYYVPAVLSHREYFRRWLQKQT